MPEILGTCLILLAEPVRDQILKTASLLKRPKSFTGYYYHKPGGRFYMKMKSALALFVLGIFADNPHLPKAANNFALHAHFLN
jgi:hypothetical protein